VSTATVAGPHGIPVPRQFGARSTTQLRIETISRPVVRPDPKVHPTPPAGAWNNAIGRAHRGADDATIVDSQ